MSKKLILLTSDFPFGKGENFLASEIRFLADSYSELVIITANTEDEQTFSLPSNCKVIRKSRNINFFQKLFSLFYIFHPLFRAELSIIKKVYNKKVSKGIIATMLISLYNGKRIAQHLKEIAGNIDHSVTFYSYWFDDAAMGLALLQKKNPQIKTCSRIHGWDVYFEVSEIGYLPYRHFISTNLSAIFPISEKGKEYMASVWKTNVDAKVKVCRLGVPDQHPSLTSDKTKLLVSCSNVIPLKRLDLIVKALSEIKNMDLCWVHFGDGPELSKIKLLAQGMFPPNITFEFKGSTPNNEIIEWYRKNQPDLFINVSSSEGIPVSIMEAMSFGIPAIATNVGGVNEIVTNENGYLLSADPEISEIINCFSDFYKGNSSGSTEKSRKAFETWSNKFNAEVNYKLFFKKLKSL